MKTAIAIAAHPDDIEFMMAGTLLLLKNEGYEIHYFNISSGSVGTTEHNAETIKRIRLKESQEAAAILGAHFHPPFCDDLEVFYNEKLLRQVAAVIREVKPAIVLTHSPEDYMEDHTTTARLAVTAAFSRSMSNFTTIPSRAPENYDCTIYHAMPHAMVDQLRRPIMPGLFINTESVHTNKLSALKAHQSQQNWLDVSQKLSSYLQEMEDNSMKIGKMSKLFKYAEGWRRHLHSGFCHPNADPLMELGNDYLVNEEYERSILNGFF